jgi:hypothetical protein
MKKRMQIDLSLYTILQIISVTLFDKKPILKVLTAIDYRNQIATDHMQLIPVLGRFHRLTGNAIHSAHRCLLQVDDGI